MSISCISSNKDDSILSLSIASNPEKIKSAVNSKSVLLVDRRFVLAFEFMKLKTTTFAFDTDSKASKTSFKSISIRSA